MPGEFISVIPLGDHWGGQLLLSAGDLSLAREEEEQAADKSRPNAGDNAFPLSHNVGSSSSSMTTLGDRFCAAK